MSIKQAVLAQGTLHHRTKAAPAPTNYSVKVLLRLVDE
jgi:hypothetical protein